MYGIFLIVILIITGGIIAFIGDHLGSKVGKKKLTVFGLRPKYTSMLVTIITGFLITTLTLGVMTVSSENVRTALFGMEKLNKSMQDAKAELANTSAELAMAKAEQNKAQEDLKKARNELQGLQQQTETLEARNQELQAGNKRLEDTNSELLHRNEKLTNVNLILEEGNERLHKNNKELEENNRDLSTGIKIMREGDITFRAGEVLAAGVIKGKRSQEEIVEDVDKLVNAARYNVTRRIGSEAPDAAKDIWLYQPEYTDAIKFISEHEDDYVVRLTAAGNMVRGEPVRVDIQLFKDNVIYKRNELILQKPLQFDPRNPQDVEAKLMEFLHEVNRTARSKGMLADSISGTVGVIDGEQVYRIMSEMQRSTGDTMISAFAQEVTNVLGPLRLRLQLIGTGLE
ncbi:MAG: DUF3084 domain-containing protein [Anaerovibrio sp.]|nr:DUF3084 domain-containing protein [Selenomonadaceae bacterium]MDD6398000.1 DUF3084 domain-containing protein [Selenomonadaceae bacterium]MDY6053083.1 DUF3084 domain-containing protein [Anaerovibrio sp.]